MAGGGRPPDRRRLFEIWERYVLVDREGRAGSPAAARARPEIVTSWERSAEHISPDVAEAPLADAAETQAAWEASPLRSAVARIEAQLRLAAEDGGLVVAVTDPAARILWTCEGSVMRRRADLSTTWDRAHPIGGSTAVAFAHLLEQALPAVPSPPATLVLRLLGRGEAELGGVRLRLTRRQLEILALLVLYPDGLNLDALHAHLYGDRPVSRATVKAEISHLRAAVGGAIASRPYRLAVPVSCDAAEVLAALRAGRLLDAAAAYRGELLAGTDAPGLTAYGNYLAVAVREALLASPDPQAVLRYAEAVPHDVDVLERALRALGSAPHAARPLLRARLRTAYEL